MKSFILKSFLSIGTLLLVCSCSDFLDQPVLGESIDTPAYYDDVDNANMAVIACYDALQYDDDMSTYQWMFADVASDDAWKGGGGAGENLYIQYRKNGLHYLLIFGGKLCGNHTIWLFLGLIQ